MRLKQSVCFPILGLGEAKTELPSLFEAVAEIGFSAVEMWGRGGDFEEIVAQAGRHGLPLIAMVGHNSNADGLNDPANHDRIAGELGESIELAVRHGVGGLICFSGNRREGVSDEQGIETTVQGLRRVATLAEKKGVTLLLELLNSKVDHVGYQADHTAWGVEVCRRVASPAVKLLFDIYHMQIMEGDIIRTIRENIQWIGHFHAAGNPGRQDMDATQELNYAAICQAIAATPYAGYFGHEFRPKGEPVEAMRRSFALCDQG